MRATSLAIDGEITGSAYRVMIVMMRFYKLILKSERERESVSKYCQFKTSNNILVFDSKSKVTQIAQKKSKADENRVLNRSSREKVENINDNNQ